MIATHISRYILKRCLNRFVAITIVTFCVSLFCSSLSFGSNKIIIKVAAIDWCPELCPNAIKKGYINEIASLIYPDSSYTLQVDYFPWSRAIMLVRNGTYDALLSPAKSEAPDLWYPREPIGVQQMCFFTLASSSWIYEGVASLSGVSIGIAHDAYHPELNDYLIDHPEQFQFQPYVERYVEQSANKLIKKRIDTFIFTKNSTTYTFEQLGISNNFRSAGCFSSAKIYMAFTPIEIKKELVKTLIQQFDDAKVNLSTDKIETIMKRYHLSK
jgi:polar amino acid transport system substrate-binding protein